MFSDLPRVSKNSFVIANTTGDSTISAIRFGIAIIAFSVSARSQTKPSLIVAPTITASDRAMIGPPRPGRVASKAA